ncbi:thioesterase family protein [uncultured Pseudosulfitobacter sp.]|uniref:thioesterase family protein n=1 Tax=uncultured Pseudosulfitobacter sp. TaxID=2854214 RepID=UPI0030D90495
MDQTDAPTLGALIAGMRSGPDGHIGHIPETWMQGRTAFGGITAALALEAARQTLPDLPRLRAAQLTYLRPITEQVRFDVTLVRAGRTSSFVKVDCYSEGALGVVAMFTFGGARDSKHTHDFHPVPVIPARADSVAMTRGRATGFWNNFDMLLAQGDGLISGSDQPEFTIWTRLKDATGVAPDVALMCLGDSLPPAAMVGFDAPAPISTITWAMDFARVPDAVDWVSVKATSLQAADGYSVQQMEMRDDAGQLLGNAQQLVALFD